MKHFRTGLVSVIVTALSLAIALQAPAVQKKPPVSSSSEDLTGSGCVESGVETGCLVLKDARTKILYNLFFKGKKPAMGSAIRFTGSKHDGPTTCMQGEAVDVKEWIALKMKCPAADKDEE
ncbi:MAG TPA: hypothetical protein VKY85_04545 [Candidatus Angelobacter sp.]|nr:hypothetical protein [Candidatus Angelobacter sp.]